MPLIVYDFEETLRIRLPSLDIIWRTLIKSLIASLCFMLVAATTVSDIPAIRTAPQQVPSQSLEYLIWQFDSGGKKIFRFPTKHVPYRYILEQEDAGVSEVNRIAEDSVWDHPSYAFLRSTNGQGFRSATGYLLALTYATQRSGPAWAALSRKTRPSTICPYAGNLVNDGCLASPGGSHRAPTFYSGYTGATYAARPNENMPGVDYANGVPAISVPASGICGLDHIQDPATATTGGSGVGAPGCGVLPRGCRYLATGRPGYTTGPTIDCAGVSTDNLTLAGFELNATGGHASTKIIIEVNATSPHVALKYDDGSQADYNVYLQGGWFSVIGGGDNIELYATSFDELWPTNFSTIASATVTALGTTVTASAVSAGSLKAGMHFSKGIGGNIVAQLTGPSGDTCPAVDCNGGVGTYRDTRSQTVSSPTTAEALFTGDGSAINTTGGIQQRYMYWGHINGRPITGVIGQTKSAGTTNGDILCYWCFVEGMIYHSTGEHGEFMEGVLTNPNYNMTLVNVKYLNSVLYQPENAAPGASTALIYMSTGGAAGQQPGQALTIINPWVNDDTLVTRANDGRQTTSALVEWTDFFFTNAQIKNNFTDRDGSLYNNLCNGAPKVGGSNARTAAFTNLIAINDNTDLSSGDNIDSSVMAFYHCSQT